MSGLKIAPGLSLPLDVAGEAIGVLATRGAGKSYTSAGLVEQLWAAQVQFVVVDPTGVYWGLRSSVDGRDAGLPVTVLGGAHGDLPLEPTAGALIADVLVDTGQSLILDFSDFGTKGEQTRFVTALFERLYARKARSRTTLHIVMDEANEFAPQKPMGRDEPRMLGAVERVVGKGRSRGIGVTLITQRSATLNKNVLDLVDTLIAMRVLSPRDRKAIKDWIVTKEAEDSQGVMDSLQSLPTGTAWVWSPVRGILKKVVVRRITTFDSYRTPKPGEKRVEPRVRADIDLDKLGADMEATRERVRANDPAVLRQKIAALEGRVRELQENPMLELREVVVEIPVVDDDMMEEFHDGVRQASEAAKSLAQSADRVRDLVTQVKQHPHIPAERLTADVPIAAPPRPVMRLAEENLPRPQLRILDGLMWAEITLKKTASDRRIVAFLAGYSPSTGHFQNLLGTMRAGGLVDYPGPGLVALTEEGRKHASAPDRPQTLRELHDAVRAKLAGPQQRILNPLLEEYPHSLSREWLAQRAGYSASTGHYQNLLGGLRTLGLIIYPQRGEVRADEVLFPETR